MLGFGLGLGLNNTGGGSSVDGPVSISGSIIVSGVVSGTVSKAATIAASIAVTASVSGLVSKSATITGSMAISGTVAGTVAGGWPTYDEFTLHMNPPDVAGNWVGIIEIIVRDKDDNSLFAGLTRVSGAAINTIATISAGQWTTDSSYNGIGQEDQLLDGIPSVANASAAAPSTNSVYWSQSGSGIGLKIFIKPSTAKSIKEVIICTNIAGAYDEWLPSGFSVTTEDGALTPITAPATQTDYYQTTANSNYRWVRWTFDETS